VNNIHNVSVWGTTPPRGIAHGLDPCTRTEGQGYTPFDVVFFGLSPGFEGKNRGGWVGDPHLNRRGCGVGTP